MTQSFERRLLLSAGPAYSVASLGGGSAVARTMPPATAADAMELAFAADAPTSPTGLAIDPQGRALLFMPRFDDKTRFSIGLVGPDGSVSPWPDAAMNHPDPQRPQDTLFHTPNGVFDAAERLWVLDAGLMAASGVPVPGAAKLLCFDAGGRVLHTIPLGPVIVPTSSLNDLRVQAGGDGPERAYITDQGQDGQGAIIAVDLASGRSVRRLDRHSSTRSVKGVLKLVEGEAVMKRTEAGVVTPVQGGANGIALSPDGTRLYYAPLMARRLYAVDTAGLLDPAEDDAAVAASVTDLGEKGLTGGLIADDRDRVFLSLQEFNAIGMRDVDGSVRIVASDPRLIWPDTFVIRDGWLYVSSSQVNRRSEYQGGVDKEVRPYAILRVRLPS